jgi:hypothetical protein
MAYSMEVAPVSLTKKFLILFMRPPPSGVGPP